MLGRSGAPGSVDGEGDVDRGIRGCPACAHWVRVDRDRVASGNRSPIRCGAHRYLRCSISAIGKVKRVGIQHIARAHLASRFRCRCRAVQENATGPHQIPDQNGACVSSRRARRHADGNRTSQPRSRYGCRPVNSHIVDSHPCGCRRRCVGRARPGAIPTDRQVHPTTLDSRSAPRR